MHSELPRSGWYFPARHEMHSELPVLDWYCPVSQRMHVALIFASAWYFPLPHGAQSQLPPKTNVPAAHCCARDGCAQQAATTSTNAAAARRNDMAKLERELECSGLYPHAGPAPPHRPLSRAPAHGTAAQSRTLTTS